jgi:hypothetical protein
MENRAKTDTTRAKPTRTQWGPSPHHPTKRRQPPTKLKRKRCKCYGRSKQGTLQHRWRCQPTRHMATTSIKNNLIAHTILGLDALRRPPAPPSGTAVPAYHRSRSSRNASCTGQTSCRPGPLHQQPGPSPRPKSQTASTKTLDRADNLTALRHQTVT